MELTISAQAVAIIDGPDAIVVTFGDPSAQAGSALSYLMLQRSVDPTDDDGVYVELGDQRYGCYNGVAGFTLAPDQAHILFGPNAAEELARHESIQSIAIDLSRCDFDRRYLSDTLKNGIFRGTAGFVENAG